MEKALTRGRRIGLAIFGAILVFLIVGPPDFAMNFMFNAFSSDLDGGAHKLHLFMRGSGAAVSAFAALVLIVKPGWSLGTAQVFISMGVGFLLAGLISVYVWPPVIVYPVIGIIVAAVVLFVFRGHLPWQQAGAQITRFSRNLLALTAIVAIPLIVFAFGEASLQRSSETVHGDLGHWAGGAAKAFMIIIMMLFALRGMPGWRVPAYSAGFSLAMFGFASIYWPNQASSVGAGWAALAIAASVAFVALAEYEQRTVHVGAATTVEQPATP